MRIRTRKLVGAFALFALLIAWTALTVAGVQLVPRDAHAALVVLCYLAVGFGWLLLAMPLVRWMVRPDAPEQREPLSGVDAPEAVLQRDRSA